jgi:hypothetical protein
MNSDKPHLYFLEPSDQDAISALFVLDTGMFLVHLVEYLEFGIRETRNC